MTSVSVIDKACASSSMVEHWLPKSGVAGSIPVSRFIPFTILLGHQTPDVI